MFVKSMVELQKLILKNSLSTMDYLKILEIIFVDDRKITVLGLKKSLQTNSIFILSKEHHRIIFIKIEISKIKAVSTNARKLKNFFILFS